MVNEMSEKFHRPRWLQSPDPSELPMPPPEWLGEKGRADVADHGQAEKAVHPVKLAGCTQGREMADDDGSAEIEVPPSFPGDDAPGFIDCTLLKGYIVRIKVTRSPDVAAGEVERYKSWYVSLYDYFGYSRSEKFCLVFDVRGLSVPPLSVMLDKFQLTIDLEPRTLIQVVGAVIVTSQSKLVDCLKEFLFRRATADQRYLTYDTADGTAWLRERIAATTTWDLAPDWDHAIYDD